MKAEELMGTWSLESCHAKGSSGGEMLPLGEAPRGYLTYTPWGYMTAVLMSTGRAKFASGYLWGGTPDEIKEAFQGFDAYGGPYEFDEKSGKITHHAEVARLPNWEGTAQVRYAKLVAGTLTLTTPPVLAQGEEWVASLTWSRTDGHPASPRTTTS